MSQFFTTYQVQFKTSRKDRTWTPWCTIPNVVKCREIRDKFKKLGQPTRLMQLTTEVTVLEET